MPKILTIKDLLSPAELELRYRHSQDPVERSHWHILWLLASGQRVPQVAQTTAYSARWIRQLIHRYNKLGPEAMLNQRSTLPGATPLLSSELQAELNQALQLPPPDKGHWNGRKVADWICAKIGRKVGRQRGWDYLKRLDYSLQQPRPHNARAEVEAGIEWKKNCQSE